MFNGNPASKQSFEFFPKILGFEGQHDMCNVHCAMKTVLPAQCTCSIFYMVNDQLSIVQYQQLCTDRVHLVYYP